MAIDERVVFDTNVIVSALLLPTSVPRLALDHVLEHGALLISDATVTELNDVLRRPKFERYVTLDERLEFLARIVHEAELVEVTDAVTECRDPKDNKFLELAVSGRASCVVSGDPDLLTMHPFRSIPIITPNAFLTSLAQRGSGSP
jgi:hypothetical protein